MKRYRLRGIILSTAPFKRTSPESFVVVAQESVRSIRRSGRAIKVDLANRSSDDVTIERQLLRVELQLRDGELMEVFPFRRRAFN